MRGHAQHTPTETTRDRRTIGGAGDAWPGWWREMGDLPLFTSRTLRIDVNAVDLMPFLSQAYGIHHAAYPKPSSLMANIATFNTL
jgi:hypothetical protein